MNPMSGPPTTIGLASVQRRETAVREFAEQLHNKLSQLEDLGGQMAENLSRLIGQVTQPPSDPCPPQRFSGELGDIESAIRRFDEDLVNLRNLAERLAII